MEGLPPELIHKITAAVWLDNIRMTNVKAEMLHTFHAIRMQNRQLEKEKKEVEQRAAAMKQLLLQQRKDNENMKQELLQQKRDAKCDCTCFLP